MPCVPQDHTNNAKVSFGNVSGTGDFEIAHDSNNTVLQNRTGGLYLKGISGGGNAIYMQPKNNESSATFHPDGAVELYFDNTERIRTTNTGAFVTGILTATSFVGDGSGLTNLPGGGSYGNSDVDTHLNRSSASSGEILSWNGSDYAWVADNVGSGSTAEVRSNTLTVSGVSTFTGNIDANGSLDVDGHTELDNVNISGVSTFGNNITASGTSRFEIASMENAVLDGEIAHTGDADTKISFPGNDHIRVEVGGAYAANVYTTDVRFHLDLTPNQDSNIDIGTNARRFANVYADTYYGSGANLTGVTGSIAGISTTGTSNFANIQLIGITTGLNVSGVLTAAQFSGDGANLTSLPAAQLSGTAAAINGSNITNLAAGNLSGTLPALDGSALTGIAVTEAPITNFTVTANGSSAYRFAGGGVNSSSDDPDLYLVRGQKYRFNNTTGSNHPFRFRLTSGGSTYSSGVSGSENGVQFFMVPLDAPEQIVYQCTIHSGMVGNIYIRGGSGAANISNNADNRVITGGALGNLNGEAGLTFDGTNFNFSRQDAGDARMYIYGGEGGDARLLLASDEGDDHIDTWEIRAQASDNNLAIYQFGGGSYNKRLTIDTDANNGDVIVNTGNLVIGTAGKGIDFSAQTATSVSGSSATSEILDHYEEGTFTPEYNAGSAGSACFASGISYNSQVGHYTKIGNVVTFQLKIDPDASGLTAKSGMLQINQLPFNCKNVSSNGGAFFVLTNAFGATDTLPNPVLVTGSNAIQFYKNNSATFAGNELPSPANYIQLAGLYFTD